jgi:hypothetical protein
MTTHVSTSNPVRSDVPSITPDRTRTSRTWALAGIGAGLASVAGIVCSGMVGAVYDKDLKGDPALIQQALADDTPAIFAFHTCALLAAVLLLVFSAGLFRRLRAVAGDGIAPLVAFAGLAGTAVVAVIGSGLDTEFMLDIDNTAMVSPDNATFFNHWIGTIPWLWVLGGVAGVAVYLVSRSADVPRWIGRVGLVLGGLTMLLGMSPLQYMAGMTGPLWLLVTAAGFYFGDRAFRS